MARKKQEQTQDKEDEEDRKETKTEKVEKTEKKERSSTWPKPSCEEVEETVIKLYKQGIGIEKIGLILRDSYGISSVKETCGKKIKQIVEQHEKIVPPEITNLTKGIKRLKRHAELNKKDMTAKRGLQIKEARLLKTKKYYGVE